MAFHPGQSNGPRRNPPRLNIINPSISFSPQQAQALFSPALQTAIHTGHANTGGAGGFPLHTPMQPYFNGHGHPANAPPRRGLGHQGRASISHFPGGQNHQPSTSPGGGGGGGHFPRPSMNIGNGMPSPLITQGPPGPGQPSGPIIINNGPPGAGHRPHRRQMSIGGPPKAVLGGPQRKVSPNPAAAAVAAVGAATLKKKINVNIPKETELVDVEAADTESLEEGAGTEEGGEKEQKKRVAKEWARVPLSVAEGDAIMEAHLPIQGDELVSRAPFPADDWKHTLPASIEVFLPTKSTWDALKQQVIESKLEKLGVERGSGSNVPHIFAPHARAASISSPADPALLLFKLNKLQQTQNAAALSPSMTNSTSPGLPLGATPPNVDFQSRHGHTMSLAQPPSYMSNSGTFGANSNPFGPRSPMEERPLSAVSDRGVFGSSSSLSVAAPNLNASRPTSRPDFIRGFGLDVPVEAEEEAELDEQEKAAQELRRQEMQDASDEDSVEGDDAGNHGDTEEEEDGSEGEDMELDDDQVGPTSVAHSRHVSRISAALSLRSIGGNMSIPREGDERDDSLMGRESSPPPNRRQPGLPSIFGHAVRHSISANREDLEDAAEVQDWTGSEEEEAAESVAATDDLSDFDDDQSLGEYSNPSDEERAREQRVERRMERMAQREEAKRRKRLMTHRVSVSHPKDHHQQNPAISNDGQNHDVAVVDQPRRIPNFPRPPADDLGFVPTQREHYHRPPGYPSAYQDRDEIISNPSEENLAMGPHEYRYTATQSSVHPYQQNQFLGVTPTGSEIDFFNGAPRSPTGTRIPNPLPAVGMPHAHSGSSGSLSYANQGHQQHSSFGRPTYDHQHHQHQGSHGQQHSSSSFGQTSAFGLISPPIPHHVPQAEQAVSSSARRESLNPFAKPFVFGQPLSAKAEPWVPGGGSTTLAASTSTLSTGTAPDSATTRLNVAAVEFKPRAAVAALPSDAAFTFSMPNPLPESGVPLSALAASSIERTNNPVFTHESSPIRKQGREKRARLDDDAPDAFGDDQEDAEFAEAVEADAPVVMDQAACDDVSPLEGNSMTAFRFPHGPQPAMMRKSLSHQPQQRSSSLTADLPISISASLDGRGEAVDAGSDAGSDMYEVDSEEEDKENRREDTPDPAPNSRLRAKFYAESSNAADVESVGNDTQDTAKSPVKPLMDPISLGGEEEEEDEYVQELIIPPTLPITNLSATFPTTAYFSGSAVSPLGSASKRRAPIPLDFKHPTGNTVPAGLFKALVQGVIQQNKTTVNGNAVPGSAEANDNTHHSAKSRYEMHMSRPSLDDMNITRISGTGLSSAKAFDSNNNPRSINLPNFTGTVANRARNATDPIRTLQLADDDEDDVFGGRHANASGARTPGGHRRRRSSLPDALRDPTSESEGDDEDEDEHDSDEENRYGNSTSLSANPSHTVHMSQNGRRVLQALSISREKSPVEVSSRMERMRKSETPGGSPSRRPAGLGSQFELHALEDVLARVLDERLSELKREWSSIPTDTSSGISSRSEAMLSEVISLFRAQLSESATKSLEDTTMEARGDMDMFMMKEMLEDSQKEVAGLVKSVVAEHLEQALAAAKHTSHAAVDSEVIVQDIRAAVENAAARTVGAVVETISDLRARQEAAAAASNSTHQQERLLDELVTTLTPMIQGLKSEPIDYEFLTNHLAQAVKPHISQLIDFASDKRETASIIVEALAPSLVKTLVPNLVPNLAPTLISNLTPTLVEIISDRLREESENSRLGVMKEVRKAVEGVDAVEIREQVADLVVERLDARLSARDKTVVATVASTVTDIVEKLSARMDEQGKSDNVVAQASVSDEALKSIERTILDSVKESTSKLDGVSQELGESLRHISLQNQAMVQNVANAANANEQANFELKSEIKLAFAEVASKSDLETLDQRVLGSTSSIAVALSSSSTEVVSLLQTLLAENRALAATNAELLSSQQSMNTKLNALPDSLRSTIVNLQNGISELIVSRDAPKKDLEDLRKLNTEYQVSLTKARTAHGQIRVEKELMGDKLAGVELERDRLRVSLAELEKSKKEELAVVEARKSELEEALSNALGRLQASDVASQMHQQRIAELERNVKEIGAEKATIVANVNDLEVRAMVAETELERATEALEAVRQEQNHWEDLKQASDKIDMLTKLIGEVESDELKDLRRYHDRTKNIEAEYASLQKRAKDLEVKAANSDKLASAATTSLAQAQQRSAEWERRANEYEGELELVKTKLDHAEQTHVQLESDHSLLKLQFEEKEADDRLNKDRDSKQRDKMAALESKIARLQDELVKARAGPRTPYRNVTNGSASHPPPRPDSRSSVSTVNGKAERRVSSYSPASNAGTLPSGSVWDSIHAPSTDTPVPKSRYPSGSIHAPTSRYPNLTPASNPRYPTTRKPLHPAAYMRANAPSPAPSNVSATPTQRDDGWWE